MLATQSVTLVAKDHFFRFHDDMATARDIRYQAAIVQDGAVLLLQCAFRDGRTQWMLPGGGREDDESETACVAREVAEETGLTVRVDNLLVDVPANPPDGTYERWRTYLCTVIDGQATPGGGEGGNATLVAVSWQPLGERDWPEEVRSNPVLYPQLQSIRDALANRAPHLMTTRNADQAAIAATIIDMERAALERWGKGDPFGFIEICADDVVYFDPFQERRLNGIEELRALYESIRGQVSIARFDLIHPLVQSVADMAVLTFNYVAEGTNEVTSRWNCTEVFRREAGDWRIIQTHWSFTRPEGTTS